MSDEDVIDSLGMHAAAVALLGGLGYAWIGGEWTKNTPKEYGCYCDLEPGMKPDGCVLEEALTQKRAEYEDLKQTMHNMARNHALQLEAARMAGVHSVQEQTAVIVRAALELLESIEGETPFTAEALRAFRRVFGA